MKNAFCLGLLLAVGAGCSKTEPAPVAPEPAQDSASAVSPAQPAPTPATARPVPAQPAPTAKPAAQWQPPAGAKPLAGRVDPVMTAQLKRFMADKGRLPNSILELAGATSDGFPLAPAGFLYAIDPATAEVKLVKQ